MNILTTLEQKMRNNDMKICMPNPDKQWGDSEWSEFKDFIKTLLHTQTIEVTFTKVDGSIRVMDCTLNPEVLPHVVVTEGSEKSQRKKSDSSIAVFDTEANGWRSFVIRNVQAIKYQ
jgi:hypothetical protein